MFKNHFKIAWRNLLRNRMVSALNIFGLAMGMAASLLIFQYVEYEFSYDEFYSDADEIYRLNTLWKGANSETRYATTPPPLAEAIREEIPEVAGVTRVFYWSDFTMRPDNDFSRVFRETNVYAADRDFFKVMDYGLLAGNPETALKEPVSVVLPESTAIRYFGLEAFKSGNILGRKLMGGKDGGTPWKVTGIMKDQPRNSHFKFDFLVSSSSYPDDLHRSQIWDWNMAHTYLRISQMAKKDPQIMALIQRKLNSIVAKYVLPYLNTTDEQFANEGYVFQYLMQPLTSIHLNSNFQREMAPNGSLLYLRIFIVVAIFIILIAAVNYINLFTAQSTKRAKEVGVRKVMGARWENLIPQFLCESLLTVVLAGIVALGFVEVARSVGLGFLNDIDFTTSGQNSLLLISTAVLVIILALLAGIYPAFYLSKFRPVEVLRGKLRTGLKGAGFRNGLVTFQFVISIGLIACTIVVQQQVGFIQDKKLGFDKENVLIIENDREIDEQMEEFKAELRRHPNIIEASFSNGIPGLSSYPMRDFSLEGESSSFGMNWYQIDEDHFTTLNMDLVEGRTFNKEISTDTSAILLNEAAVKALGLTDPIDTYLIKNRGGQDEQKVRVIGVVENFHFESLHHQVKPLVLQYFHGFVFKDYVSIRLAAGDPSAAVDHIKATWKKFEPGVPLRFSFLDTDYDSLYRSEIQLSKIFGLFTGLAIIIACLGLFGLVTFITEQRTKEISIRKVLGASVWGIVGLISKEFIQLIIIAIIIATPLAWYFLHGWLEDFAFSITLKWWVFALAGGMVLSIALITMSFQSIRAALLNPASCLKNE